MGIDPGVSLQGSQRASPRLWIHGEDLVGEFVRTVVPAGMKSPFTSVSRNV